MEQKKKLKKTLKDLTLKDNFMFCAVMMVEENCRSFLEACLGFPIGKLQVDQEKSMIWHPEYRSVRLDVYARDDENRRYNVEMQVAQKPFLAKRKRYYQSQMDMELQASMEQIKKSREMEDKFMTIGELIEDDLEEARAEGRAEGREEGMIIGKAQMILDLLQDKGSVSQTAVDRVLKEKNPSVLKEWIRLAVQAESVQQFEETIQ